MEEPDMVNECGISLYFRNNRIHIRKGTIEVLNHPAYVHLFINEGKKQMFIQSCEKNKDAFRVYYKAGVERTEESFEGIPYCTRTMMSLGFPVRKVKKTA